MKTKFSKITIALLLLMPVALLAQSNSTQIIDINKIEDNPYFPVEDKASYSPVHNILDSSLASSTMNELLKSYGDSLVDFITVKNRQWEEDKISCAQDVNDYLYAYMKRGLGNTPPSSWSKFLQANFFQGLDGSWNDFDGDGLINGRLVVGSNGLLYKDYPIGIDTDSDGKLDSPWDDWYGFGVPNTYSPLVKQFGYKPIIEVATALGLSLDFDNDNDGVLDGDTTTAGTHDPYPFFATYGDSNFDHSLTGPNDIYQRIGYDSNGQPYLNTQTNAQSNADLLGDVDKDGIGNLLDINNAGNDFLFPQYFFKDRGITGGGGEYTVSEQGPLLSMTSDIRNAAINSRSFNAQTAYETEEIKKILIDNCVRMADLQGIMSRLEFKELIADRVARDVSKGQSQQTRSEVINQLSTAYDEDGDGTGDGPLLFTNWKSDLGSELGNELKLIYDELSQSGNIETQSVLGKIIVGISGFGSDLLLNNTPGLEKTIKDVLSKDSGQSNTTASSKKGLVGRIGSYLSATAATGDQTSVFDQTIDYGNLALTNDLFRQLTDPTSMNNPHSRFILLNDLVRRRLEGRSQEVTNEYLANQGFKSYRVCVMKNEAGTCTEWASVPGSIAQDRLLQELNSDSARLENVHSISDIDSQDFFKLGQ